MNHHERDLDPGVLRTGAAVDHLVRLLGDDPEIGPRRAAWGWSRMREASEAARGVGEYRAVVAV